MKKTRTIALSLLMVLTMLFSLTACVEDVTLVNKTVNGLSFDVPSDFGEFTKKDTAMVATDGDSLASIAVSEVGDAEGYPLQDWTKESYTEATLPNYTDFNFVEFKTNATVGGSPALFAHFTTKNPSGLELELYSFFIYTTNESGGSEFQSISFTFNKAADTSLKANIDTIISSLKFA